jgi:hypothetical protein
MSGFYDIFSSFIDLYIFSIKLIKFKKPWLLTKFIWLLFLKTDGYTRLYKSRCPNKKFTCVPSHFAPNSKDNTGTPIVVV